MTKEQLDFLQKVVPAALKTASSFPIPACITIAQAITESAAQGPDGKWHWGQSCLFRQANNPFGIKASHRDGLERYGFFDAPTWEVEHGQHVKTVAEFQKYPSLAAAFADHTQLLMGKHYTAACEVLSEPDPALRIQKFAEQLGPAHCGYSTNPDYPAMLLKLVAEYRLDDPRALACYVAGKDPNQPSAMEGA